MIVELQTLNKEQGPERWMTQSSNIKYLKLSMTRKEALHSGIYPGK